MLKIENVNKIYCDNPHNKVNALKDINLEFGDTGLVFLLGKSGSGKSTLLNCISGFDDVSSGDILVDGVRVCSYNTKDFDSNEYRTHTVGFVFQDFNLIDDYSVGNNLLIGLRIQGNNDDNVDLIQNTLKDLDLEGYIDRSPATLSGGQKQRVSIARAIVRKSKILLADEPTGNLDEETGETIFELLKQVSKDMLVIVVSHDRESAYKYADRVVEIKNGEIVADNVVGDNQNIIDSNNTVDDILYNSQINDGIKIANAKQPSISIKFLFELAIYNIKNHLFRFIIMIILPILAFGIVGTGIVLKSFDYNKASLNKLYDSGITNVEVVKGNANTNNSSYMTMQEVQRYTIYKENYFISNWNSGLSFVFDTIGSINQNTFFSLFRGRAEGAIVFDEAKNDLQDLNIELIAGRMPSGDKDEILISEYYYHMYLQYGYRWLDDGKDQIQPNQIGSPEEFLTKDPKIMIWEQRQATQNDDITPIHIVGIYKNNQYPYEIYRNLYDTRDIDTIIDAPIVYSLITKSFFDRCIESIPYNGDRVFGVLVKLSGEKSKDLSFVNDASFTDNKRTEFVHPWTDRTSDARVLLTNWGDTIWAVMGAFAGFVFLLMLTMTIVTIGGAKKKLGILRSLGTKSKDIFRMLAYENLFGAIGTIILSSLIMFLLSSYIWKLLKVVWSVSFWNVFILIGIIIFYVMVAITVPIYNICRKRPIEIIRRL